MADWGFDAADCIHLVVVGSFDDCCYSLDVVVDVENDCRSAIAVGDREGVVFRETVEVVDDVVGERACFVVVERPSKEPGGLKQCFFQPFNEFTYSLGRH
jgi:hypothetical protein